MPKYLVTGGAGFIGSNLVEKLVEDGHEVIVVDNLSTGSLDNLNSVLDKIEFIEAGLVDMPCVNEKLDGIFHLGIPSTTAFYRDNYSLAGEAITEFTNILELAKLKKCKLVYASSSSIYNGNIPPFKEDMTVFVTDFYTEARYSMERLAELYHDFYQVEAIGLRFFSVYGHHEEAKGNFANLVSQFLWDIKKCKQPIIYGNGKQTRDFTYVDDIIKGFLLSMNSDIKCDIFNLGRGECYNLNKLLALLNEIMDTNIEAAYITNPLKNYVNETLADTTKAKRELGFEAVVSLEEGIKKIL